MVTLGGQTPKFWPKKKPKYPYYAFFGLSKIPNIHKNTFKMKCVSIYSKLITKQWGVTIYRVTPGGQIHKFWPKMTANIGIMSITSQFGPFENVT